MKSMKRILALVLAMVMCLGLATVAMAADETPVDSTASKITVNDAIDGQTYKAWKMLDAVAVGDGVSYKVNSDWEGFVTANASNFTIVSGHVTNITGDLEALAKAALAYAGEHNIGAAATAVAAGGVAELDVNGLGYYLIDSGAGVLCMLNTNNTAITEKNDAPTIDKEVDTTNSGVGQVQHYTITVTKQAGVQNYQVIDTMSTGLTFGNDITVKQGDTTLTLGTQYTMGNPEGDQTFVLNLVNSYMNTLANGTEIKITYTATINDNAIVGTDPQTNKAILKYGDQNQTTNTPESETKTKTTKVEITKVDGEDNALAGAEFELYTEAGELVKVVKFGETAGEYKFTDKEADTSVNIQANGGEGNNYAVVYGLPAGSYKLKEVVTPNGYNALDDYTAAKATSVTVNEDGSLNVQDQNWTVVNNAGSTLPSTGGIGTTIFYVIGGILVIGAGVLLVTKKRMSHNG